MARSRWQLPILLLSICACDTFAKGANPVTKPLSIPPSQHWEGEYGPWSTFRIELGRDKPQRIRVLPAADQSSTYAVLPEACSSTNVSADPLQSSLSYCSTQRGGLFWRNESSTWKEYGQYGLDNYLENQVGYKGAGLYGFDTLSLGWAGDSMPSLDNQSIVGILTDNFTLGSLALNARSINLKNYNNPIPSLIQNLRDLSNTPIPSLSWSYTAGAYNLVPKVFGSLVLGGYDSTRFKPNNLLFPFGAFSTLDFQVTIQRITATNFNGSLLGAPIVSYISTSVPEIWLPVDVCMAFLHAFKLWYDNSTEAFYVNSSQHASNLASNPVVSFQIGTDTAGRSVTIEMPYFNFYLSTEGGFGSSIMQGGGFRFPIKQAIYNTQYILGRAFLQSAYLSADYERKSFTLSQAVYPSSSTQANIVPILRPGAEKRRPSAGAIAGVVVGAVSVLITSTVLVFVIYRQRRVKGIEYPELDDTDVKNFVSHELHGSHMIPEIGNGLQHELAGQERPLEMTATQLEVLEMPGNEERHTNEVRDEG